MAELILSGRVTVLDEAESVFEELTRLMDRDLFKTAKLAEIMMLNLNEAVMQAFPWLHKVEETAFCSELQAADNPRRLKKEFAGYLRGLVKIIRKYELHQSESIIRKTCQYIMEHIEEDITLERVALEVHVSKDYLGKQFKHTTGINFNDYVTKMKMEYAKHLLGTGEYKNYEISEKLGYSSADYFCRLFKNYTGYTPLQYRKLWANKEAWG